MKSNEMELKNYNVYFFFAVLLSITVLTFFIMQPFLIAILMGGILAVIFQKPFKFFLWATGGRRKISAMATSLLGIILFIGFFSAIVGLLVKEATPIYQEISNSSNVYQKYVDPIVSKINDNESLKFIGIKNLVNGDLISKSLSQIGQGFFGILQNTYQGIASFLFLVIVMFFTLYYLLDGGRALVKKIFFLSPLRDEHERILVQKFISISRATVKGTLVVGIIQGLIGGILFAIAGISSAPVWGVLMIFLSLIPMVGSGLVWFPTGIIMLLMGNIWQGMLILGVGLAIISTIDNVLKPKLVGKDIQMHPLMVFFATLGGISMFGFLGFIIGPIIVALFLALWDIYAVEFKSQLNKYNA
jgi:predicted PurR-regulated permease PerM